MSNWVLKWKLNGQRQKREKLTDITREEAIKHFYEKKADLDLDWENGQYLELFEGRSKISTRCTRFLKSEKRTTHDELRRIYPGLH